MNAIPKTETTKKDPVAQEYIFCPSSKQKNAIREVELASKLVTEANRALLNTVLGGPLLEGGSDITIPDPTPVDPSPAPTPPTLSPGLELRTLPQVPTVNTPTVSYTHLTLPTKA